MLKIGKRIDLSLRILPVLSIFILASLSAIFFLPQSRYESNPCDQCWHTAYAQNSGDSSSMNENNVTQRWTDRTSGISINLAYSPTKPIVDAPTNLKFI